MYEDLVKTLRNNAEHYMTENGKHSLVHLLTDAADAIEKLNKEVMTLRSDYWDVTCDPEYRESHFQKDEWGK